MSPGGDIVDWEGDAHMKRMLEKKRKSEEAEEYNSRETMLKKRRAVKEQATQFPAPSSSTELVGTA